MTFLSELVDQEAESLLMFRDKIIVIWLWKSTADAYHVENLLMVTILEGNILVGQNMS